MRASESWDSNRGTPCRKFGGEMTVCSGKQMEMDLIADEYFQKLVYSRKDELFALGGIWSIFF